MIDPTVVVDPLLVAVRAVGLPALFAVFVLKGALVGKVLPTSVVLPGYVAATGASVVDAAVVVALVTVAHVAGQLVVFVGIRRYGRSALAELPSLEVEPESERYGRLNRWFDAYGGVAIVATNLVPWSRGLIVVPAAVSSYAAGRYAFHATAAALVYHSGYVSLAMVGVAVAT